MKIVNLQGLLNCPENTVFCTYYPFIFDGLFVFRGKVNGSKFDYFYDSLEDCVDGEGIETVDIVNESIKTGSSFRMYYDSTSRAACYEDKGELFCIYDNEDIENLISKLQNCIK